MILKLTTMNLPAESQQQYDSDTDVGDLALRPFDLLNKTLKQRQKFYRQYFSPSVVSIEDLKLPELCREVPTLTQEILDAYLAHTTVVFEVWVNYDASFRAFYTDRRIEDCGKIYPRSKKTNRIVDSISNKSLHFQAIRLIGTPFRTLVEMNVKLKNNNGYIKTEYDLYDKTETHSLLMQYLSAVYKNSPTIDFTNRSHITLSEIEAIANLCRWNVKTRLLLPCQDEEGKLVAYYHADWCMYH